jgi:putative SOS response-associated peptidase YedK
MSLRKEKSTMCGRYAVTLPPEAMRELFRTLNRIDYPPRYNIAPTQPIVVIWEQGGRRTAQLVRWGLVPGWVKDPREFSLLINARAETMAEKPAFSDSLRNQRCIVPASGYFEWRTRPDGSKQPYFVTMVDGSPMAFAGLYATRAGPGGEEIDTAAIITVPAGPDTSHIHPRTPAILQGEAIEQWLDTGHIAGPVASRLAQPLPAGSVRLIPVGSGIGSSTADGPELIAEVAEEPGQRRKAAGGGNQLELF